MVLFTHVLVMLIGSWFSEVALPLQYCVPFVIQGKPFSGKKSNDSNYCSVFKRKENVKCCLPGMC